MSTKDIRTHHDHSVCDVCGRTLLRGERAEVYLSGGSRRSVCELCKTHALHAGWVREGTVPDYELGSARSERRGSLLRRWRRRERPAPVRSLQPAAAWDAFEPEHLNGSTGDPASEPALGDAVAFDGEFPTDGFGEPPVPAAPVRAVSTPPARTRWRGGARERSAEPRKVRAVPTGEDQKIASSIDLFNHSEHRRTVAGVARSLGAPSVSVAPDPAHASLVWIVVAWELCWYRYEVDLAGDGTSVRVDAQGYDPEQLGPHERLANAVADEVGQLRVH